MSAAVAAVWRLAGPSDVAARAAWRAFLISRLLVAAVAIPVSLWLNFSGYTSPHEAVSLTHPFGAHPPGEILDAIVSSLAKWDAVWQLRIANDGYGWPGGPAGGEAAFFPLYPLIVWLASGAGASPVALLVGAYAVSLAAFLAALRLLHRLVALELRPELGAPTLMLLALFPASLFFGAPYTESLFLLISIGAFYAARTGRWAAAGLLAAAASAARPVGVCLVLPLAVLYLYGPRTDRSTPDDGPRHALLPRHRPGLDFLWLGLAPLGLLAFSGYLALHHGDALAFLHEQQSRTHKFTFPFSGIWEGTVAAFDSLSFLLLGAPESAAALAPRNLMLFAFLVFGLVATVGVFRRLPAAYGVYVVALLFQPLSLPIDDKPLDSLGRYLAVIFPLFMWLALVCEERRRTRPALVASSAGLALLSGMFAGWMWVA